MFEFLITTCTLRSLINELARLTIVTIVKHASLFNRDLRVQQKGPFMQDWVFRLGFWAWRIPFIALVGEKMGGREAKLWHHLLFWDERKTLSNVFTSHHFQNDASETQLFGGLFDLIEKWKKNPNFLLIFYFILLCMVTVQKIKREFMGLKDS